MFENLRLEILIKGESTALRSDDVAVPVSVPFEGYALVSKRKIRISGTNCSSKEKLS